VVCVVRELCLYNLYLVRALSKKEMHENFEEMKKEYNVKFDTPLSDEDIMDIGGHDQMSDQ
jgi:hypothetical protein